MLPNWAASFIYCNVCFTLSVTKPFIPLKRLNTQIAANSG